MEKYIGNCIDSLKYQITEDIEVIIIDDGSTDSSMGIIREKLDDLSAVFYSNFKLVSQLNQGQSVARNNAIDLSSGEYIAFIDADDVISDNYIENIVFIINRYSPDVLRCGAKKFISSFLDSVNFLDEINFNGKVDLDEEVLIEFFNQNNWYPWLYIFKKNVFKQLRFPSGMYFEDACIIPELLLNCKNIYIDQSIYYYYRENYSGSSLNREEKNIKKLLSSSERIVKIFADRLVYNPIYSASYLSMAKLYVNYLIEFRGIRRAYMAQKLLEREFCYIDKTKVLNIKMRLYFFLKFNLIFLIFLIKKIRKSLDC